MDNGEKRRIAHVIAGAVHPPKDNGIHFNSGTEDAAETTARLLSDDGNTWWAVMDWVNRVEGAGWWWEKRGYFWWVLHGPDSIFHEEREIDERWARLSCITQAIKAGVLK